MPPNGMAYPTLSMSLQRRDEHAAQHQRRTLPRARESPHTLARMDRRLAWVTTRAAHGLDDDEPLGVAALQAAGADVEVVAWDDDAVEWARYDRAILRSTWDYDQEIDRFNGWLEYVDRATDLQNPLRMLRWGLDKRYLLDLAAADVPITPTALFEPGETAELPAGDVVVKPAVGAGSRNAASYGPEQAGLALAHVRHLHEAGVSALVQPMLASVAEDGEWPLVFFGGRFSHAASKRVVLPRAGGISGLFAPEANCPHTATPEQLAVAEAAVSMISGRFGAPTYARVDLVRDDQGKFRVLEVELVEPSLFLPYASLEALTRLTTAFLR